MTQATSCGRQGEKGFTLVELAIVMIIIGLLIGGILKGQELIANARITSQVAQVKGIDAAMTTFRDQYNSLPGDIANPQARLPNCAAALCNVGGNGDSQVASDAAAPVDPSIAVLAGAEAQNVFIHLAAAGVLGGVAPNLTAFNNAALPPASIGTGMLGFGFSNGTMANAVTGHSAAAGHYLVLRQNAAAAAVPLIQPKTVANIDRKLDDNSPLTGSVIAVGGAPGAATCASAAVAGPPAVPSGYNEGLGTAVCGFVVRIQQ